MSVFRYSLSVEHPVFPVFYFKMFGKTMESNQRICLDNFDSYRAEKQLSSFNSISGKILRGYNELGNSN